jgi:peptide-methionine (S)-S-oxide reductase
MAKATFAAGCFWGVESLFRQTPGVTATRVGYIGGWTDKPDYKMVCRDDSGHAEAVELEFDPSKISYPDLLKIFFENHDPTTLNKQGPDIGTQYRSAIFCHSPEQFANAMDYKEELEKSKKFPRPVVTQVIAADTMPFFAAEEYHQRYFEKQGITHCAFKKDDEDME